MGDYFVSAAKLQTNPDPKSWYLGDLWSASK
jgi:hypothetical protein